MSLYQNARNGQIVELISYHDKDYAMVRSQSGTVSYASLADLHEYKPGSGRTGEKPAAPRTKDEEDPDVVPTSAIPPDTRLNLNLASADMIAHRIKGIGFSTAKRIVELRMSLPGEKFQTLEQVKSVALRGVNWDTIIEEDLVYVG